MNTQANIAEFRRLEAEIIDSEADVEAKKWRQAELASEAVADGISRREYAKEVRKDPAHINRLVLMCARWGEDDRPQFTHAYATIKAGSDEILTETEVRGRQHERQVPTRHDDRVEMVEKLLADPKVAKAAAKTVFNESTLAGRLLASEVRDRDTEQKRKYAAAAKQSRDDKALPLPAYMADMVVKINEWSLGLAALVDDLDELPEGRGRELVTIAVRTLNEQTQRWLDKLEPKPELRVIEGRTRAAS